MKITRGHLFRSGSKLITSPALIVPLLSLVITLLFPALMSAAAWSNYGSAYAMTATTTAVSSSSSNNTSSYGVPLTLSAKVTPSAATGTVTFYDGVTTLGTGTLSNGTALYSTSTLTTGTHSNITASYGGDVDYSASTSLGIRQTVIKATVSPLTFGAKVDYGAGSAHISLATGDFNRDGKLDVATANNSSNSVSILLGNGNGAFAASVNYGVGMSPRSVTTGDFNGDGKADLATTSENYNFVSVLLGNGDGTFAAKVDYGVGDHPWSVTTGDFNNDGKLDLVTANVWASTVSVLPGNGDGTFAAKVDYTVGGSPYSVISGDFNNDGRLDIATCNWNTVSILPGIGDGTFGAKVDYGMGGGGISIAAADFNGDGQLDLATANYNTNTVSVLVSNGSGTFRPKVDYAAGTQPWSITTGDFNGDGKPDLAMASGNSNNVSVLLGIGDGTFAAKVDYNVGGSTYAVTTGDFNGDGRLDLAAANVTVGTVSILLNNSFYPTATTVLSNPNPASFGTPITFTAVVSPVAATGTVTFYDGAMIIGTGILSAGTATCTKSLQFAGTHAIRAVYNGNTNYATSSSAVYTHTYYEAVTVTTLSSSSSNNTSLYGATVVFTAKVAPAAATGTVTFYDGASLIGIGTLSGGTAVYTTSALNTGTHSSISAAYGGNVDYAASNSQAIRQTVTKATVSPPAFSGSVDYGAGAAHISLATGDFNRDGKLDLVTANNSGYSVSILLGNGNGAFAASVNYGVGMSPRSVTTGDFNGDGKADLATTSENYNFVSVLLGNGDGTFAAKVDYGVGDHPWSVTTGDFNNDGKLDLVTANVWASTVSVLPGNGDGTFAAKVDYTVGGSPYSVISGDFNNDGRLDIATCNWNTVSILPGIGDGTFGAKVDYGMGGGGISIAAADFNGDGQLDLATANYNTNTVSVLVSNGSGTFRPKVDYAAGTQTWSVTTGDFNGDGKPDLAMASGNSNNVSVLLGIGDGTFAAKVDYNVGGSTYAVTTGDFNGDGRLDLAAANVSLGKISVLLGNSLYQTATTISASPNPAFYGLPVTFTATVDPSANGTVAFSEDAISLATGTLSAGTAIYSTSVLSAGTHTITAFYSGDSDYATSTISTTVDVQIDDTPPVTTGSAASYTFGAWTMSSAVTVTLSVNDGAGSGVGAGYPKYCVDTANSCTPNMSYSGAFTVTCPAGSVCTQYVRYQSQDIAGNLEAVISTVVKQDLQAPATTPLVNGGSFKEAQSIILGCSDTGGSGCAGTTYCTGAGCTPATTYTGTIVINTSQLLRYSSRDAAGNSEAVASRTYTIDTEGPSFSGIAPADRSWSSVAEISLSGTVTDAISGVSSLTINGTSVPVSGNTFSLPVTLVPGTNTYLLAATDVLGNQTRMMLTYYLDTVLPNLEISTLPDGSHTTGATLNITGIVTDRDGIQELFVGSDPVTFDADGRFSVPVLLVPGENLVQITVVDLAGNNSTVSRTIVLDPAAPALAVTSPADGLLTARNTVEIAGTADDSSVVTIQINDDDPTTANRTESTFSTTVNLDPGINTILVLATDLTGSTQTAKRTVFYDFRKPGLAVTSPDTDVTITNRSIALAGAITDALTAVTVRVTADGTEYTPAPDGNGLFTQPVTFAQEGIYPLIVVATDENGNSSRVQRNVRYQRGSIVINQGAFAAKSATVNLALAYSAPTGTVSSMQFLYNNTAWTSPMAFALKKTITLPLGDGVKTVFVRYIDNDGAVSAIYSDTIILDTKLPVGSITINDGAQTTTSPDVILSLAVADVTGVVKMQFSNNGTLWTTAEPFTLTKSYLLPGTNGTKTVYARFIDSAGKISAAMSDSILYAASTTPITTADVNIKNGDAFTITTSVPVKITNPDPLSSTYIQTRISLNGTTWGAWSALSTSKTMTVNLPAGDGVKTVYAQCRKADGTLSPVHSDSIILDTVPPKGTIQINSGLYSTNTRTVALTLTASDLNGVKEMQFSLNNTAWTAWEAFNVTRTIALPIGQGVKTVWVKYKDNAGKVSAAVSDTIVVDSVAPIGTVVINNGATVITNRTVTLSFSAAGATYLRLSIDGGATWAGWEPYVTSKKVTFREGDETKTVQVYFRDLTGNISTSPASDSVSYALARPPLAITVPESNPDGFYAIAWTASPTAGVTYELQEATNSDFNKGLRTAYSGLATTVTITSRTKGVSYYYRVRAKRTGYESSSWTTGANGCKVGSPAVPASITAL